VREYAVQLLDSSGGLVWAGSANATAPAVALPVGMLLERFGHGSEVVVSVSAISHAGLATTVTRNVSVDRTPPMTSGVFNGKLKQAACTPMGEPFQVTWTRFVDAESGIQSIHWALGFRRFDHDLKPWSRVDGYSGRVPRLWEDTLRNARPGIVVYSTLRVRNGAGDAILVAPPPIRVVKDNQSRSFVCLPPAAGAEPHMLPFVVDRRGYGNVAARDGNRPS